MHSSIYNRLVNSDPYILRSILSGYDHFIRPEGYVDHRVSILSPQRGILEFHDNDVPEGMETFRRSTINELMSLEDHIAGTVRKQTVRVGDWRSIFMALVEYPLPFFLESVDADYQDDFRMWGTSGISLAEHIYGLDRRTIKRLYDAIVEAENGKDPWEDEAYQQYLGFRLLERETEFNPLLEGHDFLEKYEANLDRLLRAVHDRFVTAEIKPGRRIDALMGSISNALYDFSYDVTFGESGMADLVMMRGREQHISPLTFTALAMTCAQYEMELGNLPGDSNPGIVVSGVPPNYDIFVAESRGKKMILYEPVRSRTGAFEGLQVHSSGNLRARLFNRVANQAFTEGLVFRGISDSAAEIENLHYFYIAHELYGLAQHCCEDLDPNKMIDALDYQTLARMALSKISIPQGRMQYHRQLLEKVETSRQALHQWFRENPHPKY